MKKDEFAKLALLGIASGMLASNGIEALQNTSNNSELLASACSTLASSCKSCSSIADKSNGNEHKCSQVASSCKSCNSIADKCGGINGKCQAIAETETKKSLTAPGPIPKTDDKKDEYDPNDQNIGYHVLSEEELTLELNDDSLKIYQKMSPEAKELTRLVASARCNKTNECRGLNACKTDTNDCAGKGSCKGTGKCAISDKNLAVKLVQDKMEAKRQNLTK